jgi:hypothetical protein
MSDYSTGKIYTVRYRGDNNFIYVGSTINLLTKRWNRHKSNCRNVNHSDYNKLLYQKIRETDDIDNWYVELYEAYPCENRDQLTRREGQIIREIGTLNMMKYRYKTPSEYKKEWRQNVENREKDKERLHRKTVCDCGVVVSYKHKQRHLKSKHHLTKTGQICNCNEVM